MMINMCEMVRSAPMVVIGGNTLRDGLCIMIKLANLMIILI
jgi:hypothetical protein